MRFAVIDDEPEIAEMLSGRIRELLHLTDTGSSVQVFVTPQAFLASARQIVYDAVFLDIDMPDMTGFQLSEIMQAQGYKPCITYITNRSDLVYQSFRYSPLGFVRKEFLEQELPYAVETILHKLAARPAIDVREIRADGGAKRRLFPDAILYIESCDHIAEIHLMDGEIVRVRKPLHYFEESPGFSHFFTISSGRLVNLELVRLKSDGVLLPNGQVLTGSRRKMREVCQAYLELRSEVLL